MLQRARVMWATLVKHCGARSYGGRAPGVGQRLFSTSLFNVEVHDGGICVMEMAKPPVNTFDIDMMNEFSRTLSTIEADESIHGLVLTSAFPGVFCAGLDLKFLHKPSREDFVLFWSTFESMWSKYYTSPLCTVAVINGSSPALGAVLSLASDYRVMLDYDKFRFGLNETSLGMIPPLWLQAMTERTLGKRGAEYHLQFSSMLTAKEALQVGYVDALAQDSDAALSLGLDQLHKLVQVPKGARYAYKLRQRQPIAEMAGEDSVNMMADNILGYEFQHTVQNVLDSLAAKRTKI